MPLLAIQSAVIARKFGGMPVIGVLASLTKFRANARNETELQPACMMCERCQLRTRFDGLILSVVMRPSYRAR